MIPSSLREASRVSDVVGFAWGSRWLRTVVSSVVLVAMLFPSIAVQAKIGAQHQMLLGNPSSATTNTSNTSNYLIQRDQYALSYNNLTGQPNWVSWNLTADDIGSSGRADSFAPDLTLPNGFTVVYSSDYNNSGYDRGHMCPSGDRTITRADNDVTFYMSNIIPQTSSNNQGVWANFENYCRSLALNGNEVLIITGPSFFGGSRILSGAAAIPGYTWKIVVVVPPGPGTALERITSSTRVIAIRVPNTNNVNSAWQTYLTTVNQLQQDTGYTFFSALAPSVASVLRATIDGQPVEGIPSITSQPISQSAAVSGTATFSVSATGNAPLSYQWYFEGEEIPDATGSTLILSNLDIEDMGSYFVTVSNSVGTITSASASLIITGVGPAVVAEPESRTVGAGSNVVLSVLVSGSPTMTYQWRKNGTPIQNAIFSVLTLNNVQAADFGSYDVVITNSVGSVTSTAAQLTVSPASPTITTQPVSRTVGPNGTTSFTVVAVGTQPLSYQWRKGGVNITNNPTATNATLSLTSVTEAAAGSYDVVVTNSVGSATSNSVTLTVSVFANGAINLTGGTYTQNFNTLRTDVALYDSQAVGSVTTNGPWALESAPFNGSGMIGWWAGKYDGSAPAGRFAVDDGSFISGSVISYGTFGSSDRALGLLASGSNRSRIGAKFVNSTGQTLTSFSVSYTGEQWRRGTFTANVLAFAYAINATDLNTGDFVDVGALDFVAPIFTAPNAISLDGNASSNRTQISHTISNIIWPAGATLIIRWTDVDDGGSDDGLAIDDFSMTVAQPAGPTAPAIISTTPTNNATAQSTATTITVNFNQPVTVGSGWFSIMSASSGPIAATVNGGPDSFIIAPPVLFPVDDTITVTFHADKITDLATGGLTMAQNYTLSFATAAPQPPSIVTQPQSQSVPANSSLTFSVAATGTAPLSYQWRRNGTPINTNATATSSTLSLFDVQAGDAGSYDVVISNAAGSVTSTAATLTVTAAVTDVVRWNFTNAAPSGGLPTGLTGGTVSVGNGNNSGSNPALIASSSVSGGYSGASGGGNAGAAVFTGAFNAGSSTYFQFTLTPPAGQRISASGIAFGARSTLTGPMAFAVYTSADSYATAVATGTLANDSTWRLVTPSFTPVNGAVGAAVTFRIYGYNGAGTAAAGSANWRLDDLALTVVLQSAPSITVQPTPKTVDVGETTNFSVSAQGTAPFTYQWRRNGEAITGNASATTATLTLTNVQTTDAGGYDVVVTNAVTSVTSNTVALTVQTPQVGFSGWRAQYFTAGELQDPAISGPNAILAGDGITNLMKYALGLDPRAPAVGSLPDSGLAEGNWTFTYDRPVDRSDIAYTVEVSTDLTSWTTNGVTLVLVGTSNGVATYRATYPASETRLFFRLRVATVSP